MYPTKNTAYHPGACLYYSYKIETITTIILFFFLTSAEGSDVEAICEYLLHGVEVNHHIKKKWKLTEGIALITSCS